MLIRLPDFALADCPERDGISEALQARNAVDLRAVLKQIPADSALSPILVSLALHFEGDKAERQSALSVPFAAAEWRILTAILLAIYAAEDKALLLSLQTLNAAYNSLPEVVGENRQALRLLIIDHTAAVDELAKEAHPRPLGARKLRRRGPVSYVVSYPRSGNTMLINALAHIFRSPWYSVFPGDGPYFCRELYDPADASVLLIKDHLYKNDYSKDRVVYIVRDGRDSLVSLCRFLEPINDWRVEDAGMFANFMTAIGKQYLFRFWADNVRLAVEAQEAGADVMIWRYEDIVSDRREYLRVAEHIAADRIIDRDLSTLVSHIEQQRAAIDDPQWGYGAGTRPPQLFAAWSRNRGGSNWRTVFNRRARKVFHELGGTEMLLRFGYETDPDWWRHDDDAVERKSEARAQ